MTKCSALVAGFLFLAVGVSQTGIAQETTNPKFARWLKPMDWKRDSDQPVFTIGKKGEFDDQHILAPSVIFENGEFWMYYIGSQTM